MVIIDQEDGNSTECIPIGWEEGVRDQRGRERGRKDSRGESSNGKRGMEETRIRRRRETGRGSEKDTDLNRYRSLFICSAQVR